MTDKIKNIHVILKDTRIDKFNSIKNKLELNSDVDVMRSCLDIAFKQVVEDKISLKEDLLSVAENLSKIPYLQRKFLVFSVNDILNDALNKWILNHYSEYSLFSFSFRKELSEDEQRIALIFVEQQSKFPRGMTLNVITSHLTDIEEEKIQKIIKNFVDNQLVETTSIRGEVYYYAPLI